jgi:hypothetical protein
MPVMGRDVGSNRVGATVVARTLNAYDARSVSLSA